MEYGMQVEALTQALPGMHGLWAARTTYSIHPFTLTPQFRKTPN